ncbi:MAG: GNAT family N-acetyltransferase [Bacteroidota bacterium]
MPDNNLFVTIRPAKRDDCPRILELVRELAIFEEAEDEVVVDPLHFTESGFGPNPVWWTYVAEVEGTIVGIALYYIRFSTWEGQKMYLEDIIITEEWRGKGIGNMLMEQLIQTAKEKGFVGMNWQVLNWNESAIKFYKKYNAEFDHEWVNCYINFY